MTDQVQSRLFQHPARNFPSEKQMDLPKQENTSSVDRNPFGSYMQGNSVKQIEDLASTHVMAPCTVDTNLLL
jgi:hypothetical protein